MPIYAPFSQVPLSTVLPLLSPCTCDFLSFVSGRVVQRSRTIFWDSGDLWISISFHRVTLMVVRGRQGREADLAQRGCIFVGTLVDGHLEGLFF